jgi:hypothetical protein
LLIGFEKFYLKAIYSETMIFVIFLSFSIISTQKFELNALLINMMVITQAIPGHEITAERVKDHVPFLGNHH